MGWSKLRSYQSTIRNYLTGRFEAKYIKAPATRLRHQIAETLDTLADRMVARRG